MFVVFLIIFFCFAVYTKNEYTRIYDEGVYLLKTGNYKDSIERFNDIPNCTDYRDISELLEKYELSMCPNCGSLLE